MTDLLLAAALAAVTNLPTVVVEASRIDATQMETPSGVQILGSAEIASSGARSATDLLAKRCPQLHLRQMGAGNPALAELSLRGYGENGHGRTLVLVDGERLNAPDLNAPDLSRIALGSVSKIEVLGGPQTVLHGDGASAGVVNVVTEPQEEGRHGHAEIHGGSWGRIGGSIGARGVMRDADGEGGEGENPGGRTKYWANGAWDRADGFRSQSQYNLWNADGGVKREWASGTSLRLSAFYEDAQYDLPGALTYAEAQSNPRLSHANNDRYHRAAYGVNAAFDAHLTDETALKTIGTFSNRKMWAYQKGAGWFSDNEYDIYSYRLTEQLLNASDIFGFGNEFLFGGQYGYDLLNGAQRSNATRQCPTYDRQSMDFFAQDTFRLADWLALQPGARYSRVWSFNNLCERDHRGDHLGAFDLALIVNPTDASKVYVKESRLYRNPFLDEVPGRYDAGYHWVNTEILRPEQGWNTEIGFEVRMLEEVALGGDLYGTWLEDEIFYDAGSGNNVNAEDGTFRRGVDLHAAWEREKVAGVSLAASYVKATFDGGKYGHNLIPLVPAVTVSANARVWVWDECFVFGGYRFQDGMVSCSDFQNRYPGLEAFGLFHIGATYEPAFAAWAEGLRLTVSVDNLFDERYCDYSTYGSSYWPGAGRCWTVSLGYSF